MNKQFVLPKDCRGDGYDIACAPHDKTDPDVSEGSVVAEIYANGYFCAHIVSTPDPGNHFRLCQHSGSFGPWYHVSEYTAAGKFAGKIGGHYSRARASALRLPFGRPKKAAAHAL